MEENKFIEKTLVLIKPDAVIRGISGKISSKSKPAGALAMKFTWPTKKQLTKHFPVHDESWIKGMGEKTLDNYRDNNIDPVAELGTSDPLEIGNKIVNWNFKYMLSGPVIAIIFKGIRAVSVTRKIIGNTIPAKALPGTIRGDFSVNSADYANSVQSACKNVVHASGNIEEADTECKVWFEEKEIIDYKRSDERAMFC